jgi:hypothetical protein
MELARNLKTLWQRRGLLALGAVIAVIAAVFSVYRVGFLPPSLSNRSNVFATASTEILVDTHDSSFADIANDITPLATRAGVFARFLQSPAALTLLADDTNLPVYALDVRGPVDSNLPVQDQQPTAERRSSEIIGEDRVYRLRLENNPILPLISVFAQAPSQAEAVRLANAAPRALRTYVKRIQAAQNTPPVRKVDIRQLGLAQGGVVNKGADVQIAALVFLAVFGGWCILLIPAQTIARGWRDTGADSQPGANGGPDPRRSGRPPRPGTRRQRVG